MPVCIKCGTDKPQDDFYAHSQMTAGRLGACKECHKANMRENRAAKAEYYRAYDRKRYREQEKRKELARKSASSPNGLRLRKAHAEKTRVENPEKYKARNAVSNAIRDGKLVKGSECFFCSASENLQGHHPDYSHPLDVVWLCPACHGKLHTINGDFRRKAG